MWGGPVSSKTSSRAAGTALLGPGTYHVVIAGNGGLLPSVLSGYTLKTALMTDPTGVPSSDPNNPGTGSTPPPEPSGYNYYNDQGYYTWGEKTPTGDGG